MPVLVEDIMTRQVISVNPFNTVMETLKVAKENRIRHIPIVEESTLKGVVSDRDLRSVSPSVLVEEDMNLLEKTLVKEIMITNVITIHPLDTVEEAARLLYIHKIGCLPVVTGGDQMMGIITDGDVLASYVEMMGILEQGSVIQLDIPDRPGTLAKVLEIITEHGVNIISIFMPPKGKDNKANSREIIIRLQTIDPSKIIADIKELGFLVIWPELWGGAK
ncbi:MAG: CBS domain-containing protein [Clostridia bacterium]|nr:CBS domain-containing protein [Clostridia bacterium]